MLKSFQNIKTFVFDVDGVLTDGTLLIAENNLMLRTMNVKDGYALQLAVKKNYLIIIISGGNSAEVKKRLNNLGVENVFMKVENKLEKLQQLIHQHQLQKEEILFMGDDVPDIEVMQRCGLTACPSDAVSEIKNISQYVSPFAGGKGCVRDVIEKVLKLQNNWRNDATITSS